MKRVALTFTILFMFVVARSTGIERFYCLASEGNCTTLHWEVQCSDAHRVFILEKSYDKVHFARIAQIEEDKAGEPITTCSFSDHTGREGWVYYRLTVIDNSGAHTKTIRWFVGEVA